MDTPKNQSSSNGALWVIAVSLSVIAACLVVLVSRQQRQREVESVQIENVPPPTAETRRLPKAFTVSPGGRSAAEPSPAAKTTVRIVEVETPAQPAVTTPQGPEPIVSSGLAPLTYLAATNSPDSSNSLSIIKGRVTLNGMPPPENSITALAANPQCGRLHNGPVTTHFFQVSKDGGLADVFVYIKSGLEGKRFPTPNTSVRLDQTGCFYEPYVLGLMVNQKLQIRNSDPVLHNVHADPMVSGNEAFNVAESPGGMAFTRAFRKPEIGLRVKCDIHPWMFAYVCVVDNPFFAVTDTNGNYSISNVPPGNYVLEAFHRKTHGTHSGLDEKITVTVGETTTANFAIELPRFSGRIAERK